MNDTKKSTATKKAMVLILFPCFALYYYDTVRSIHGNGCEGLSKNVHWK